MELKDRHHFERHVPTYAEPISADDLREGDVYFSVQYADEALLQPTVETLVFTGAEKDGEGATICCFQDLMSYQQGIKRGSPEADCALFYFQPASQLKHIFGYDCALDELIRCSLRRSKGCV
jgi:hypothetical protein